MSYIGENPKWTTQTNKPQSADPANPVEGMVFRSDGTPRPKGLWEFRDGVFQRIAGETGDINYITNPDAEVDATGYSTYADAAATTPVDGTGGAPNITFTRNTSSPLRDTGDFDIAKTAADRQGEGVSNDFTIDSADKGQTLQVTFDYAASANFADADIGMFIFDVTNASLIQMSNVDVLSNSKKFTGSFIADLTSTSYRLIWHIASTNASAWDFNFDNVRVGPANIVADTAKEVRAWLDYDGVLDSINASNGIASVVTNGTGDYTITWEKAFSSANYSVNFSTRADSVAGDIVINEDDANPKTTSAIRLLTSEAGTGTRRDVDNIYVTAYEDNSPAQPAVLSQLPISDWIDDGTITISAVTTPPTKGTIVRDKARYRRIGDSMEIRFEYEQSTAGTAGVGSYLFEIPGGFSIDTAKVHSVVSNQEASIGNGTVSDSADGFSASSFITTASVADSTHIEFWMPVTATNVLSTIASGVFSLANAAIVYTASVTVPIQGWSANLIRTLPLQDTIDIHTGNGHGSTNTKIRRFTTVLENSGSAMTLTQDATNGDSVTINQNGIYSISYTDSFGAASSFGISKNSSELTTNVDALTTQTDALKTTHTDADDQPKNVGETRSFSAGDVIRAHTNGAAAATTFNDNARFTIVRIA